VPRKVPPKTLTPALDQPGEDDVQEEYVPGVEALDPRDVGREVRVKYDGHEKD
jgi:hypothetical protein